MAAFDGRQDALRLVGEPPDHGPKRVEEPVQGLDAPVLLAQVAPAAAFLHLAAGVSLVDGGDAFDAPRLEAPMVDDGVSGEQMADIERRMKQLRARKQRIVARENAKARKRRTHLIIRLGGILSNEGVLGYDEGVWNDEGNRQRLLDMLKAHAAELRAWASDAGVRLPSAESAGELREQVRDLPQEPQIQEQPGYGYQPGFQQPQQWQQQPWN